MTATDATATDAQTQIEMKIDDQREAYRRLIVREQDLNLSLIVVIDPDTAGPVFFLSNSFLFGEVP